MQLSTNLWTPPAWLRRARVRTLFPAAGIVGILVVWEIVVRAFHIPRFLLVGPIEALNAIAAHPQYFATNTWDTLVESSVGFAGGMILGIVGGLAIFYVPLFRNAFYPSLIALNTIPKVALAPLFIVWFGAGESAKVLVALLIAFFPVLVSTIDGLGSVPEELKELAAINNASFWQRFWWIDFVYALPAIFTGMKVSITMAVGGAVVGEFIAGKTGLGFIVIEGEALVDLPAMFSALLLMSLMALVLFLLVEGVERLLLPWARYREIL